MISSCPTFIYCTFIIIVNIVKTKETLRPEDTRLVKGLDFKLKYLFGLMKYLALSIYINTSTLQCFAYFQVEDVTKLGFIVVGNR